ncbi:helix-turn-helix transcriptional regulator [Paenibacillus antri]|uniref:Helix-turn-helix transcriptional regulator n=1 Tax=Paenibacillus antri TaxID=2582848 RepID=A0A5R9GE85_9BACL|nr:helix-turn-helix domain-containing protein [Paenibacillus antri]TLS51658.1 helix-turn-helix transcriptional regulator [Paenibacillus antri]
MGTPAPHGGRLIKGAIGLKHHGYYRKLLVSYLPIFFSAFTVLVIALLLGSMYLSREAIKRESLVMAKFVNAAMDRELKALEDVLHTDLLDKSRFIVLTRLNPTHNSYYSTYELSVMLRDFKVAYPLIDSIYIYRFSDRSVQSMNVTSTFERFGDREFIRRALEADNIDATTWTGVRDYREFDKQQPERVVTLTRTIPVFREAGGLIVMNVKQSDLLRLAQRLSDPNSTYLAMSDAEGNPMLSSGPEGVKIDASSRSEYSGYTIRLGYREGVVSGILDTLVVLYIVIGFIVIVIGMLWMIYATRKNYRPIQAIVAKLDHLVSDAKLPAGAKGAKDEFGFVEQVLEKMIEQSTEFEQRHKELASFKRRLLFAELREGGFAGSEEEAREQLAAHGWHADAGGYLTAVAELDDPERFAARFSDRDQSLLKFALYNVLVESASARRRPAPWADWAAAHQIALLYPANGGSAPSPEEVEAGLREALAWIEGHLKITATIGVGAAVTKAKAICDSFGEARRMLKYKHALGGNRVIGYGALDRADRSSHMGLIATARDLAEAFRLAAPGWRESLDGWFDDIRKLLVPEDRVELLLHCLLYHVRREVAQLSDEFAAVWNEEFDEALERRLREPKLAADRGESIRALLKAAGERFADLREANGRAAVLGEVRAYIDRHYADPNLSLAMLSDKFEMNSKTLSRSFKEQFGENFVDYLMRRRIAEAKLLLLESGAPIQDISREVGYANALSFTRAFKRMEGVTPVALRKA